MDKSLRNRFWYFSLLVLIVFGTACDEDELAPTLPEIISSGSQTWQVTALVVDEELVDETLYQNMRYIFNLDDDGNPSTYSTTNVNATLANQGYLPDYYSTVNAGSWSLGGGGILTFDEGLISQSRVEVGEDPQPTRISFVWLVPEDFDKTAPEVEIFLAPAN